MVLYFHIYGDTEKIANDMWYFNFIVLLVSAALSYTFSSIEEMTSSPIDQSINQTRATYNSYINKMKAQINRLADSLDLKQVAEDFISSYSQEQLEQPITISFS